MLTDTHKAHCVVDLVRSYQCLHDRETGCEVGASAYTHEYGVAVDSGCGSVGTNGILGQSSVTRGSQLEHSILTHQGSADEGQNTAE